MIAQGSVTPAAASHVNGDVVGGLLTFNFFGSGSRVSHYAMLRAASLRVDNATIETTAWTLHLYSQQPAAIADDAPYDLSTAADRALYMGSVAIPQIVDLGSTLYVEAAFAKPILLVAGTCYGYLVNGTTLTPNASAHVVTLWAEHSAVG